jgi:Suppressor of forked protein (Suf)
MLPTGTLLALFFRSGDAGTPAWLESCTSYDRVRTTTVSDPMNRTMHRPSRPTGSKSCCCCFIDIFKTYHIYEKEITTGNLATATERIIVAMDPRLAAATKAADATNEANKSIFVEEVDANDTMEDERDELMDAPLPRRKESAPLIEAHAAAQTLLQQHQLLHAGKRLQPFLLPTRILMPSPYPQHNTGTSRFRTAFSRILQDSYRDTEAWQAVMTEASACESAIFDKAATDQYAKLDWVESCFGALLHRFPYAVTHITGVADLLLQQITAIAVVMAMPSSSRHLHAAAQKQRSIVCHTKLTHLFQVSLGVDTEGDESAAAPFPLCSWVVELWLVYIRKVQHDATISVAAASQHPESQRIVREAVTAAYDSAVAAAGDAVNNHLLWRSYIEFVQSWTVLSSGDPSLIQRQMLQLRSVYQRAVAFPMMGLDALWQEYEIFEKKQSEALAAALIQELSPKYQHARTVYLERNRVLNGDLQRGRLATPPVSNETDDDYHGKMLDEFKLLRLWKTRCSYERTNPGRWISVEFSKRIRSTFAEMACTLTRHPETWHMWSTWELLQGGTSTSNSSNALSSSPEAEAHLPTAAARAVAVLQLGQENIPDSTLLAYAEAQIYELHHPVPSSCCEVLDKFLHRSPNTLGFVLYQQLIRRYQGKEPARAVFTRARRTLLEAAAPSLEKSKEESMTDASTAAGGENADINKAVNKGDENGKRRMVTNRLDISIGAVTSLNALKVNGNSSVTNETEPITWHLYAAHATIEHRQNHLPEVAARVYELGLRNHAAFLTMPLYIQRYAQLLLELKDTVNLRALLTRAVAACEIENKPDALASLWDMTLHFEAVGFPDPSSVESLHTIEKRRHEALLGPDVEDVATGGIVGVGESVLIGAQKSSIGEQLIREDGYDVSSRVVNGLSRTVDVLNVMGLWGSDSSEARSRRVGLHKENSEFSGGKSDICFQKRLMFEKLTQSGESPDAIVPEAGSRVLTARERMAGPGGASGVGGGTAIMLAIQQSPDWLRSLLLLLPASQLRLPIVAKPPPHLTEMALSTLRQNELPAERPVDDKSKGNKRSVSAANGGNSSDDDDDAGEGSSGYGIAFRARQKARMTENGVNHI